MASDIPPKEETIIDVELTTLQKQYYRAIFERNHTFLYNKAGMRGVLPKLMNIQVPGTNPLLNLTPSFLPPPAPH